MPEPCGCQGIQLVKRVKQLDDRMKQKAEVAAYFQRFDEAASRPAPPRGIDCHAACFSTRIRTCFGSASCQNLAFDGRPVSSPFSNQGGSPATQPLAGRSW